MYQFVTQNINYMNMKKNNIKLINITCIAILHLKVTTKPSTLIKQTLAFFLTERLALAGICGL